MKHHPYGVLREEAKIMPDIDKNLSKWLKKDLMRLIGDKQNLIEQLKQKVEQLRESGSKYARQVATKEGKIIRLNTTISMRDEEMESSKGVILNQLKEITSLTARVKRLYSERAEGRKLVSELRKEKNASQFNPFTVDELCDLLDTFDAALGNSSGATVSSLAISNKQSMCMRPLVNDQIDGLSLNCIGMEGLRDDEIHLHGLDDQHLYHVIWSRSGETAWAHRHREATGGWENFVPNGLKDNETLLCNDESLDNLKVKLTDIVLPEKWNRRTRGDNSAQVGPVLGDCPKKCDAEKADADVPVKPFSEEDYQKAWGLFDSLFGFTERRELLFIVSQAQRLEMPVLDELFHVQSSANYKTIAGKNKVVGDNEIYVTDKYRRATVYWREEKKESSCEKEELTLRMPFTMKDFVAAWESYQEHFGIRIIKDIVFYITQRQLNKMSMVSCNELEEQNYEVQVPMNDNGTVGTNHHLTDNEIYVEDEQDRGVVWYQEDPAKLTVPVPFIPLDYALAWSKFQRTFKQHSLKDLRFFISRHQWDTRDITDDAVYMRRKYTIHVPVNEEDIAGKGNHVEDSEIYVTNTDKQTIKWVRGEDDE
jgi:hypothetical protein